MRYNRCSIPRPAAGARGELTPRLLSAVVLSCLVGGCGGSAQSPNPTAQTPLGNAGTAFQVATSSFATNERVGPSSSTTEVLRATNVHFGGGLCIYPGGAFSVRRGTRTASGPYPGTFTAHGYFGVVPHHAPAWYFSESFAIRSGTSKISGTISGGGNRNGPVGCDKFGSARLRYTSNHGSGDAQITIIQRGDFSETLHNL